jgi:hypothetical protein
MEGENTLKTIERKGKKEGKRKKLGLREERVSNALGRKGKGRVKEWEGKGRKGKRN